MGESYEEMGRRLVRESRLGATEPLRGTERSAGQLRWGAHGLDDDAVWQALLGALAETDRSVGDLWTLGDGFVAESVLTRPDLEQRLLELRIESKDVAALFSVMSDPAHNPESADEWRDPAWLARGRKGHKRQQGRRKGS